MFDRYKDVLTHLPEYSHNVFRKGYFTWLLNQCKGWGALSYLLLAFNFVLQIISLVQSFSQTPLQSIIAFISGTIISKLKSFLLGLNGLNTAFSLVLPG